MVVVLQEDRGSIRLAPTCTQHANLPQSTESITYLKLVYLTLQSEREVGKDDEA